MPELTRDVFVSLWQATKANETPEDDGLARMQKFMQMHDDMHAHFDRIAADPDAPLDVEGENLLLHIAMDAATEQSLEADDPSGVRLLMQNMLHAQFPVSRAFHVLSQAMTHEFVTASSEGNEMDKQRFLARAAAYAEQAGKLPRE